MDKIPKLKKKKRSRKSRIGQNLEWTKSRIGQNPELNKIPNCTKSRIGQNPNWAKFRMGKSELDKVPNWTKSRFGQNPDLDKIQNRTNSRSKESQDQLCTHCWFICTNNNKSLICLQQCMSFIRSCRAEDTQRIYQNRVIKSKNFAVLSSYFCANSLSCSESLLLSRLPSIALASFHKKKLTSFVLDKK